MAEETGTWTVRWTLHALASLAERRIPRATADAALQEPERIEVGRDTREVWMKRCQNDGLGRPIAVAHRGRKDWTGHRRDHRVQDVAYRQVPAGTLPMKIQYDPETDALTITLRPAQISESDELRPGLIADFDKDGGIVRLEILDASRLVERANEIQFAVGA
jgi:uncharacterized protein YuzE